MSKRKNCINCGAPIDPEIIKCPYCGTCHIDFSAIDLAEKTPIYITYRVPERISNTSIGETGKNILMTQLAIPSFGSMEMSNDSYEITDGCGTVVSSMITNKYMATNITFEAIPMSDNSLCKIQYEY